ncbi:hypothetical protein QOT17_009269 [Balamuthia mandrillaris]
MSAEEETHDTTSHPQEEEGGEPGPSSKEGGEKGHGGEKGGMKEPPTDLYTDNKWLMAKLDLPGLNQEDFEIQYDGKTIIVSGVRQVDKKEGVEYFINERVGGEFKREIEVPEKLADLVQKKYIDARYKNGVLKVMIKLKKPQEKRGHIVVNYRLRSAARSGEGSNSNNKNQPKKDEGKGKEAKDGSSSSSDDEGKGGDESFAHDHVSYITIRLSMMSLL